MIFRSTVLLVALLAALLLAVGPGAMDSGAAGRHKDARNEDPKPKEDGEKAEGLKGRLDKLEDKVAKLTKEVESLKGKNKALEDDAIQLVSIDLVEGLKPAEHPKHRFYPLNKNSIGKPVDVALKTYPPPGAQAELGDAFGSRVVACWAYVPAYLHVFHSGPKQWAMLEARIVNGKHVEVVTCSVGGEAGTVPCRILVAFKK